ncbi:autorepressor SdpR family transcription factor [Paenibacillus sp. FSL K6-1096]|uniref:autorepressor SdpR family transcription factor n=1 Tax=Paenibacillus sp. FSL K6-1096 TaxID=2921460 RepID=UPI0030EF1E27
MNESFKALADPTRRQILKLLREKDRTAGEIADFFNMSKPSISHHLNALKHAGLIQDERKGQFILYSLDSTVLEEVLGWFLELTGTFKGSADKPKAGFEDSSPKGKSNPGTILNMEDES